MSSLEKSSRISAYWADEETDRRKIFFLQTPVDCAFKPKKSTQFCGEMLRAWVLLCACVLAHLLTRGDSLLQVPPQISVDLSAAPRDRYRGAVRAVLERHSWEHSFGVAFSSHNLTLFDNLDTQMYELLTNATEQHHPEVFAELQGISDEFSTAGHIVSVHYLVAWLWFHELAHTELSTASTEEQRECTAAVVQDQHGNILHGRNMDQSPTAVRNATVQFEFFKDSSTSLGVHAVDWYWFAGGFMTAVKKGVGSVQENWRFVNASSAEVFEAALNGVTPQLLAFKYALLGTAQKPAAMSFVDLTRQLCHMELAAADYVVMGGCHEYEATICARGAGSKLAWSLSMVNVNSSRSASWPYLLQTNYDECIHDPATDPRCSSATAIMESLGQTIGADSIGLMATMTSTPIRNADTAYTAIMSAEEGTLVSFAWD